MTKPKRKAASTLDAARRYRIVNRAPREPTQRDTQPGSQPLLLRQVLMNALRSSPFLSAACLLHIFILSCCVIGPDAAAAAAGFADRQLCMNALRSSPF